MIRKNSIKLSLTHQYKLIKISRSSIYYIPVGMNAETLKLIHEIDPVFTKYPIFGSCQIAACFRNPVSQQGDTVCFV